jgi:translocation and assembly module TamB
MKRAVRWARRGIIISLILGAAVLAVRSWVVPAVIAGQLRAKFHGPASFSGWWLGGSSAGVEGLSLREGSGKDAPEWLTARRVETDLSIGGFFRGRFAPTSVAIDGAKIALRFDAKGGLLTKGPFEGESSQPASPPDLQIKDADLTIDQEGRPPLLVRGVSGHLVRADYGERLELTTDDPRLGRWTAGGRFDRDFKAGSIRLASGPGFVAGPHLIGRVPFVPPDVWANVAPQGRVDVVLTFDIAAAGPKPLRIRTEVTFRDTEAKLPSLGVVAEHTTGKLTVEEGVVRVEGLAGQTLSGTIALDGTMDFSGPSAKFDLNLALGKVDVASAPKSWQLDEVGATGRLTGKAHLVIALSPNDFDMSGSSGEAVIEGATLQGFPIKSLSLTMQAQGKDLQFETKPGDKTTSSLRPLRESKAILALRMARTTCCPGGEATGGAGAIEARGQGWSGPWTSCRCATRTTSCPGHPSTSGHFPSSGGTMLALFVAASTGLQAPPGQKPADQEPAQPASPRFRLPKSITTTIELEDVNLSRLLARLEALTRIKIPVPIAGHLALKADATIPLGTLAELKAYTIRGSATLKAASIDGVDLGRLSARFDLDKGVLTLDDLEGQLVERPDGDAATPPPTTPARPAGAPLVPGSFRGKLRAELSPEGKLTAHFDADELPIGELLAPYFPRPTPVAGRVSAGFDASAEVAHLGDARAWSASGRVESRQISYQGATLDAVATRFSIDRGLIRLPDLVAQLGGHPLKGKFTLDMDGHRAFSGQVDVSDWAIERVFALIPGAPRPAPASGQVEGYLTIQGTLMPVMVRSDGKIVVRGASVESIPLGDVAATWVTEGDEIRVKEIQARPFSGRFTGHVTIPISPGNPIRVEANFDGIDTARLASAVSKDGFKLSGLAVGRLVATIPGGLKGMKADLTLESPSLTVQGVPTGQVTAEVHGKDDVVEYELWADGPEGKVRFKGNLPLAGRPEGRTANAELRAAGFTLAEVASLIGIKAAPTLLHGRAAIDANLRARQAETLAIGVHGFLEVRDLVWGPHYPIGNLRGVVARTPDTWRLDQLRGDLLGGSVSGVLWGDTPRSGPHPVNFDLEADRASLPRLFAFAPHFAKLLEGFGTLKVTGRLEETLRATAEASIPRAKFAGIAFSELRLPAEITYHPGEGTGIAHARRWSARVAGGRVQGTAWQRIGLDHSFSAEFTLNDIDVESIARVESNAAKPGSGKIHGKVSLAGPDASRPERYRGKIDLDLDDASIGDIPVIRELNRFLGAAQGGAFEDGDLHATIYNRRILIDELTLAGRVIQIHATGIVTFDGQLDLAVLVNTNQIIPQTGQALIAIIPGLREVVNRNEEALLRVSSYLSNRLLKFRIGGTIKSPNVAIDPGIVVTEAAAGFFSGVLKMPLGFVR